MSLQGHNVTRDRRYALITAAWNEEAFIKAPLDAVTAQTVPPLVWVIVSDASSDRTDDIVGSYAKQFPYIRLLRLDKSHDQSFAAQIEAINAGYDYIRHLEFEFVGNLDADISVESDYFERVLAEFEKDRLLGLAGGVVCDRKGGSFAARPLNRRHSVPLGVQCFRRQCFDALGGYRRLAYGSADWYAEVQMRMLGWDVRSIEGLPAMHHRSTGTTRGMIWYCYRQGLADYSLGTHPIFELAKVARRLPYGICGLSAVAELAGFIRAHLRHEERAVSQEFVTYLRKEQVNRLLGRVHL